MNENDLKLLREVAETGKKRVRLSETRAMRGLMKRGYVTEGTGWSRSTYIITKEGRAALERLADAPRATPASASPSVAPPSSSAVLAPSSAARAAQVPLRPDISALPGLGTRTIRAMRVRWQQDLDRLAAAYPVSDWESNDEHVEVQRNLGSALAWVDGLITSPKYGRKS